MTKKKYTMEQIEELIKTRLYLSTNVQRFCDRYYILYWSGGFINATIRWHGDLVHHQGVYYIPTLLDSLTIDDMIKYPGAQYKISFRRLLGVVHGIMIIAKNIKKDSHVTNTNY
jgi:hypothetical protein